MGMFDDVICKYPLPLPADQGELAGKDWSVQRLQTKDFECFMEEYVIREDGTLWKPEYAREDGEATARLVTETRLQFTGAITMGNFLSGRQADYSVAWEVKLVDGKVESIRLLEWESRDNSQRLAQAARHQQEAQERDRFLRTWVGRHVYPAYAWCVNLLLGHSAYRICQYVGERSQRLGWALSRLGGRLAPYGDPIRGARRLREWDQLIKSRRAK